MTDLVEDVVANKAHLSMERSQDISQLMVALAKAQGEIGEIPRNKTVTVRPKSGGAEYKFKYASLDAIVNAIKKPLADNGIARTQVLSHDADGGFFVLTTSLFHGNEFLSSKVPLIAAEGGNQQFGSALTYMKRYALAAMLGLAADEDDDGNAADGNEVKSLAPTAPKKPAPDPISSGLQPIQPAGDDRPLPPKGTKFYETGRIEIPYLDGGNDALDWMKWGQMFIAQARAAPTLEELRSLKNTNAISLKNMEEDAPKMFVNLSVAMIKLEKEMEKKNG